MSSRLARAWPALVVATLAIAPAWGANAPIYKCFDSHLSLVYTDIPCKDGEQLDIRAGDADPVAVARLERARDQLDQSAAQRMLDERRAAERRAAVVPAPQYPSLAQNDYEPLDYGYAVYPAFVRPPHRHPRPQALHERPGFAPRPPFIVPRP
ncbi:MAG TPA: hypothetical protein VG429_02575 [Casimicrobiaceae bacterium]|jgi:hypothetical protein|nr:hypothetical protein [Casimicrobiaceae bacterium]